MLAAAKQIGLQEVMQEAFPEQWDLIIMPAIYVVCQGSIMSYIDDRLDSTKFNFITEHIVEAFRIKQT